MDKHYTNYLFDLYGTLADIHTEEDCDELWVQFSTLLAMQGAFYTPQALHRMYLDGIAQAEQYLQALLGCGASPEIDIAPLFRSFYTQRGIEADEKDVAHLAMVFRMLSLRKLRLFPGVPEMLQSLKAAGRRVFLLSNAQSLFTRPELRLLELEKYFDGILLSSEAGRKKPDPKFYSALIDAYGLDPRETVMVGNDDLADCHGAARAGLDSMYVHTEQSPVLTAPLPANCRVLETIADVALTI